MILPRMRTGDKSIQSLNPMGKTMLHQKVQSTIGRWWFGTGIEYFKNFISPKSAVLLKQDFKHPPSRRSQLQPGLAAMAVRGCYTCLDTVLVVMGFKTDHSGLICYTITFIKPLSYERGLLCCVLLLLFFFSVPRHCVPMRHVL